MARASWLAVVLAVIAAGGCKAAIGDAPGGGGGGGGADGGGGGGADSGGGGGGGGGIDAPTVDAPPSIDAALGNFGTATPLPIAMSTKGEDDPVLTSDGLQLIFAIDNGTGAGKDLYLATRATTADPFGTPAAIGAINTANNEESPRLTDDDLTLYYASNQDIFMATRTSTGTPFGAGTKISYVSTAAYEKWFDVCPDGYYIVSRDNGATGQDLFEGHLGTATTGLVANVNSSGSEISTFLTHDCLSLYFASNRGGTNVNIYKSTRPDEATPWTAPVEVTDFGTSADDEDLFISKSGRIAVFATQRGATNSKDIYTATR